MRNTLLALFGALLLLVSCNSSSKNNADAQGTVDSVVNVDSAHDARQLNEVITRFARAYISQDSQKANKLVHPDLGLYIIYRPGAMDTYYHADSLDFENPVPRHYPYPTITNDYPLSFQELPVFDCATDQWDKQGFIADTTKNADQLTYIAEFRHEFEEVTDGELAQIKSFERGSYRIVLTSGENLIFHVKKHEGSWYVIVIDRAYGTCDA
ncbi:hypothetical protein [Sphingobacterium sp. JB170]|uniref:hypothetical protein n=1 Tax=Sphingobacterium sp. JB170 TaxID=1434842 RepID=UPI00097E7A71|nr:hypothetical protein [Sphingobacterium sp. JB170]SJN21101.1 hypothetical protein FM107_02655 [Sphingobacterium sp. JB170]